MNVIKIGLLTEHNEIVGPMHAIAGPILTNLPYNPASGIASTLVTFSLTIGQSTSAKNIELLGHIPNSILIHAAARFASFFVFRGLSINESTLGRIVWQ